MTATTLQAVSGAGYPGVASLDIIGNVVPYIGSEEEDGARDTKILGDFASNELKALPARVSAQCNRVPWLMVTWFVYR
ncbi:MAG: Asd/ArgC dimerization domain-containing protein [Bryobacteraceae bacterium]